MLPTLAALRAHATAIAEQVLEENAGRWESASARDRERVEALTRALVNRLLHEPTVRMKELRDDRVHARMALVRDLFGLGEREDAFAVEAGDAAEPVDVPELAAELEPVPSRTGRRSGRGPGARATPPLMRIGTRGSALALAQARWVAEQLGDDTELVRITTSGDRARSLGDKSRWVSALEQALLEERVDIAVHSAKDVPGELAAGLELVAIPPRADARDAICGRPSLRALASGARIGTSSLRRTAQIRAVREDVDVVEAARQRRYPPGASSPTARSMRWYWPWPGCSGSVASVRPAGTIEEMVPAAGQGALAIEAVAGAIDPALLARVNDPQAAACVTAERELDARSGRFVQYAGRCARASHRRQPAGAARLDRAAGRLGMAQ